MTPIITLVGKAGSGKDTVAGMLNKLGGVSIAFADPLKRLALELGFTEEQLWGPSERRSEALDLTQPLTWHDPHYDDIKMDWLRSVGLDGTYLGALEDWAQEHVFKHKTVTARHFLQYLGTEFGRNIKPSIWVDAGIDTATQLLGGGRTYSKRQGLMVAPMAAPNFVTITDGRFRNEVIGTKKVGGLVVRVVNPHEPTGTDTHASEAEQDGIPDTWFDYVLENDKNFGLDNLEDEVVQMTYGLGIRG